MDPEVRAQFNQLKGLILQVKKNTDTLSESLPTVDFCCDMFDRADRGALDGYWDEQAKKQWTIRDGALVQQASGAGSLFAGTLNNSALASLSVGLTGSSESYAGVTSIAIPSGTILPLWYAAKMSLDALNVRIQFRLVAEVHVAPIAGGESRIGVAQPIGIGFGDDSGRVAGVYGYAAAVPSFSAPGRTVRAETSTGLSASAFVAPATSPDAVTIDLKFGDANLINQDAVMADSKSEVFLDTNTSGTLPNPLGGTYSYTFTLDSNVSYLSHAPLTSVSAGANELQLTAGGFDYGVSLNGSQIYSTTSQLFLERPRVSIMTRPFNQLASALANSLGLQGIISFKAWPIGKPEPPDQTGHGVYIDNAVKYTDKYHDSDGNYNPEA